MNWLDIGIVFACVAVAAAYLLRNLLRTNAKSSTCGSGCQCPARNALKAAKQRRA